MDLSYNMATIPLLNTTSQQNFQSQGLITSFESAGQWGPIDPQTLPAIASFLVTFKNSTVRPCG